MAKTDFGRLRDFSSRAGQALLMKKGEAKRMAIRAVREESRELSGFEKQAVLDSFHDSLKAGDISANKAVHMISAILGRNFALKWLYQAVCQGTIPEVTAMKLGAMISSLREAKKRIKLMLVLRRGKERQVALRREVDPIFGLNPKVWKQEFDRETVRITDGLRFNFSCLKHLKDNLFPEILGTLSNRERVEFLKLEIAALDKEIASIKEAVEHDYFTLEELRWFEVRIAEIQADKFTLRSELDQLEAVLKKDRARLVSLELRLETELGQALDGITSLSCQADFMEKSLTEVRTVPKVTTRSVDQETREIIAQRLYEDAEEERNPDKAEVLIEQANYLLRRA